MKATFLIHASSLSPYKRQNLLQFLILLPNDNNINNNLLYNHDTISIRYRRYWQEGKISTQMMNQWIYYIHNGNGLNNINIYR